jgi:hypothetical protein
MPVLSTRRRHAPKHRASIEPSTVARRISVQLQAGVIKREPYDHSDCEHTVKAPGGTRLSFKRASPWGRFCEHPGEYVHALAAQFFVIHLKIRAICR